MGRSSPKLLLTAVLVTAFASSGVTAAPAGDTQAMFETASGFYGVYQSLHPSDGIPDAKLRMRFAPFVSPGLAQLFADGEAAEQRFAKLTKNQSPPLIEGDLFSPNFEGATSLKIGQCTADASNGRCPIAMTYDDKKDKPLHWTDTMLLVHTAEGWRVDDIDFGAPGGDFSSRGSLKQTLRDAINDGNSISN